MIEERFNLRPLFHDIQWTEIENQYLKQMHIYINSVKSILKIPTDKLVNDCVERFSIRFIKRITEYDVKNYTDGDIYIVEIPVGAKYAASGHEKYAPRDLKGNLYPIFSIKPTRPIDIMAHCRVYSDYVYIGINIDWDDTNQTRRKGEFIVKLLNANLEALRIDAAEYAERLELEARTAIEARKDQLESDQRILNALDWIKLRNP